VRVLGSLSVLSELIYSGLSLYFDVVLLFAWSQAVVVTSQKGKHSVFCEWPLVVESDSVVH